MTDDTDGVRLAYRLWFGLLLIGGLWLGAPCGALAQGAERSATVAGAPPQHDPAFDAIAADLLRGLARHGPGPSGRLRIAIFPFDAERIPITPAQASALNRRLMSRLVRAAPPWLEPVARADLAAIMTEVEAFAGGGNPVAALLDNARVDVLVVGQVARRDRDLVLSYDAYRIGDGRILATGGAQVLAGAAAGGEPQLTLDAGVRQIATYLHREAGDMQELLLGGVRYQDSGLQPPFGFYLQDQMQTALERAYADLLTGRKLIVKRAQLPVAELERLRLGGVGAGPKAPMRPEKFDPREQVYVLSGAYWETASGLEIRFRLRDGAGRSISDRVLVRRDSLPPDMALRPPFAGRADGGDRPGPIGFRLSSDRGPDPAYRIGEKLRLLIELRQDAYIYCFYHQADGTILKIVPNRYYPQARLAGGRIHTVPGDLLPFDMTFLPPAGAEMLKCFATDRDVEPDLPPDLRGTAAAALPQGWDWRLSAAFRGLQDVALSEASLMITLDP